MIWSVIEDGIDVGVSIYHRKRGFERGMAERQRWCRMEMPGLRLPSDNSDDKMKSQFNFNKSV